MVSLAALWLPIVLAAIVVFLVSSVLHMFPRYHYEDLRKAPQEVHDAIVRATNRVVPNEEPRDDDGSATSRGNIYGGFWGEGNKPDDSCGSILD